MEIDKTSIILSVSSDELTQLHISSYLKDSAFTVREAENCSDCLSGKNLSDIDLLLVDLCAPQNEYSDDLAAFLAGDSDVGVIVIADLQSLADVGEALRRGACGYLVKPISERSVLVAELEKGLKLACSRRKNQDRQDKVEPRGDHRAEELSSVNKRLHEVVESTKRLLGSGELEQSGQIILEEFGCHMNAEGGSIYQVTDFGLKHLYSLDPGHATPFLPFPLDDSSVFARALNSSEPYRVIDISSEETLQSSGWQHYADNSMLFFSICDTSGKTNAIISLHSKKNPPFIAQDREIGALLASYAGEALQTAQAEAALKKSEVALMQAQKMEAIGNLAGGIAHDFNNILSAIIGYTDLSLYAGNLKPDITNNLEQVQKASNRARDLIKQILTFSRSGEFEEEAVDVSPIIKEALKLLRAVIPSSIEIKMDIPKGLGKVLTDPTRIHQVLMNLCSNAAQAMADGGGEIAIKLSRIDKENYPSDLTEIKSDACVCLTVTDDGSGMDSDVVGRIFDPYFTTKQKSEGTGLGLAVVQGIVLQSEGAIRVLSRVGLGSTFILYLPIVVEQDDVNQLRQDFNMPHGIERILFVDDEEALAEVTQEMLQKLGYEVEIQTNSVEALHRFRAQPDDYDLLITDQTMPDLSGMELAREALTIRPDIPVVLYTGYSSSIDESALRRIGIQKYLMKPLSMTKLASVIRQILDS